MAAPFAPGNQVAGCGHNLSRSQKRQALLDKLYDLARHGSSDELRLSATIAWLNRVEGRPVATAATMRSDALETLDDAQLEDAIIQAKKRQD